MILTSMAQVGSQYVCARCVNGGRRGTRRPQLTRNLILRVKRLFDGVMIVLIH